MSIIKYRRETLLLFGKNISQSADLTMGSLANNAGRVSALYDRGDQATPDEYFGHAQIKLAVAAAIGATFRIYLATSNEGTDVDGDVGTADAALASIERLRNMIQIATLVAHAATVGPFTAPIPLIRVVERYIAVVVYNEMGQALTATQTDHYVRLIPVRPEII